LIKRIVLAEIGRDIEFISSGRMPRFLKREFFGGVPWRITYDTSNHNLCVSVTPKQL
jgi:hypothetical protein